MVEEAVLLDRIMREESKRPPDLLAAQLDSGNSPRFAAMHSPVNPKPVAAMLPIVRLS